MILGICDAPETLGVLRIVQIVVTIIKVVVPILLIVSAMIDFARAVSDGELNKISKPMVNKVIAAVLVFLIPTFVKIIANIAGNNGEYENCLGNITVETINNAYNNREEELVKKAENTLSLSDYNNGVNYLVNIKDKDKKAEYEKRLESVKDKIDEERERKSSLLTSGLGKDITLKDKAKNACNYILNAETTKVRLYRCKCGDGFNCLYTSALPGGGKSFTAPSGHTGVAPYETEIAKDAIPLSRYIKGTFSYETHASSIKDDTLVGDKFFTVLFKQTILADYRLKVNSVGELQFPIGTCTQCYSDANMIQNYDSGLYKDKIDSIYDETLYYILVSDTGELIEPMYHDSTFNKIIEYGKKTGNFLNILDQIKENTKADNDFYYYKNANWYDCRNLVTSKLEKIKTEYNMFLGDSRTSAYDYYSKEMGMDLTKDKIIARSGTSYDSYFKEHLAEALQELKTSNKTYNVTVNYGVNGLQDKGNFCSDYLNFVKQMGDNNFYIVSVTPVNDSVSPYARNSKITQFNDYMLNECLPKLKEANRNVYYCDVYNKIPLKDWMKYVDSSGFHFNGSGYKFIYESIKECTQ